MVASGKGENKVKTFAASILAKRYLDETYQVNNLDSLEYVGIIKQSYEKVLTLQSSDGSFDLWGTNDRSDLWSKSTNFWSTKNYLDLTAYILKLLVQYESITPLDNWIVSKIMNFVAPKQKTDGSFDNEGKAQFKELEKASKVERVSLTSNILIGLLERSYTKIVYDDLIKHGLDFIEGKMSEILEVGTNYEKAMVFYLYVLAGKDHQKLLDKINQSDDLNLEASIQIEISSYIALGLIKLQKFDESLPIVKFIKSKWDSIDGFGSTTSTVLGLQALTEMAKALDTKNSKIKLTLRNQNNEETVMNVIGQAKQSTTLPPSTRSVKVNGSGSGIASLQILCSYQTKLEAFKESFDITVKAKGKNKFLSLQICVKTKNCKKSRIALMEVNFPAGFKYIQNPNVQIQNVKVRKVKRSVKIYIKKSEKIFNFNRKSRF